MNLQKAENVVCSGEKSWQQKEEWKNYHNYTTNDVQIELTSIEYAVPSLFENRVTIHYPKMQTTYATSTLFDGVLYCVGE